jgi:hypothetical protein
VTAGGPLAAALLPAVGVVLYVVAAVLVLRVALRWAREAEEG